ncbi:MAG: iron export ABC transporter permease subunit FetB [Hyphomicrobium sp.]|jgi:putative ABC transport system permease protein
MTYVSLSYWDLLLAAALLIANGAISWAFRLGLEKSIAIAAARMVVQLALIGVVLKFIFSQASPLWTLIMALVMVVAAAVEIVSRLNGRMPASRLFRLSSSTLLFVGTFVTVFGVGVVIGPDPWYAPRFMLPILGMVLGNTMTAITLVLDSLSGTAQRERAAIEARLALGARRFEALSGPLRSALRTGMTPMLNAMATTGIVALPGMMTGQIIAGADPVGAAKYQVLIMFLIAGATALGSLLAAAGGILLLTDERERLRLPDPTDKK